MKKWQTMISKTKFIRESTQKCLEEFDPIGQKLTVSLSDAPLQHSKLNDENVNELSKEGYSVNNSLSYESLFYQLGTNLSRSIDLSKVLLCEISDNNKLSSLQVQSVILF